MNGSGKNHFFKYFFTNLSTLKAIFVIVILGFIVFFNSFFNNFVWDDILLIVNNPDVYTINIPHFFGPNSYNFLSYYRPIAALYFALLHNLFGSQAFFYHFVQILLHIINTVILYLFFNKLLNNISSGDKEKEEKEWDKLSGSQKIKLQRMHGAVVKSPYVLNSKISPVSLFLSLVFLVHPINVESVSYISGSLSELFFLFGILALMVSIKNEISLKDLFFVSGFSLLSLLTKETGFLFILMILFFQLLFNRNRFLKFFASELIALIAYSFIRFAIGGVFFEKFITLVPVPIANASLLERLINIPAIIFYYLTTTLFPLTLVVAQRWIITKITWQDFFAPLFLDIIFLIVLYLGGVFIYRHARNHLKAYIFFFLWFICGLLLTVQIFPLNMTVADRWFYFPLVGMLGMLGVGIQTLFIFLNKYHIQQEKYKKAKITAALFGVVLISLLSLRTTIRNADFHDVITLFSHDAKIQDNPALEDDLGVQYFATGNIQESFVHLQKSVNLQPFSSNLFHLGNYYEYTGNLNKAKEYYYKALSAVEKHFSSVQTRDPRERTLDVYTKLTRILLLEKEYTSSEKVSKKGVQYYPESGILWKELALSANKLGHYQEAIDAIKKAKIFAKDDQTNLMYSFIVGKQEIPSAIISMIVEQF